MAKVACEIIETVLENADGIEVDSVQAVCSECGHETDSFGTDEPSRKRCLAIMREECPTGARNFYVEEP